MDGCECEMCRAHRLGLFAPELLEVLKQVEWTNAVDGGTVCPWCGNRQYDGHHSDCPRQIVLSKTERRDG